MRFANVITDAVNLVTGPGSKVVVHTLVKGDRVAITGHGVKHDLNWWPARFVGPYKTYEGWVADGKDGIHWIRFEADVPDEPEWHEPERHDGPEWVWYAAGGVALLVILLGIYLTF